MEKETKKNNAEQELELKTLEDIDKTTETTEEKSAVEKDDKDLEIERLNNELELYKNKYTKAVEVNNQLYQRLTSPQKPTESALQSILNRF